MKTPVENVHCESGDGGKGGGKYYLQAMQKPISLIRAFGAALVLPFLAAGGAEAARSVSYYGITWYFAGDHEVGSFVNGEPYVIGPVTITNIDPNPTQSVDGVQHGSMINPVPNRTFGFDSHPAVSSTIFYEAAKNVALSFPIQLKQGDVLVSARSQYEYPTWLRTVCALTVLSAPPPAGSFRPSIFGTDRTVKWNESQVNWSVLKNYPATPSTPSRATIAAQVPPLPWFEWASIWSGNLLQPRDNTADGNKQYGRETAMKFGNVALWLNTNQPLADKRQIALQIIQNGIDIHSYVKHGGGYYHDGGHKCGRKLPMVIAAMMLNDPEIRTMAANPDIFQEDTQTFIVSQSDVGRQLAPGAEQYVQGDVGMGEWGIRHRYEPIQDNRNLGAIYRTVVGPGMMPCWVAAHLMGAHQTWNHPAAFAYMHRYNGIFGAGNNFSQEMYNAYQNNVVAPGIPVMTPVISPAGGGYDGPQTVSITCATDSATIHYTTDGSDPSPASPVYGVPFTVSTNTTVKAMARKSGLADSGISVAGFTIRSTPPTFSPVPGAFQNPQSVSLSTSESGAVIRYTTDGSQPGESSLVYSSPISVNSTTTIKAVTIKPNGVISGVASGTYVIGAAIGSPSFVTAGFDTRTTTFTYTFDVVPSGSNIDAVVGFAGVNPVTDFSELACTIRFSTTGRIDVRNGSIYAASADVSYSPGVIYSFKATIDPQAKKYSVTVSADGGPAILIAENFAFRTEQAGLSQFRSMAIYAVAGSHSVSNYVLVPDRPRGLRRVGGL